jgi:hypothetical protein
MSETTMPKPVPTLRVGVTGHRANKLPPPTAERLRPVIRAALERLKGLLDRLQRERADADRGAHPVLRIVSPLAEGADRLVAAEGLALGAELLCPLPFLRLSYRRDFVEPASLAEFDALILRATSVIELGGDYDTEDTRKVAYAAVGEYVVDESDAVIALWDGEASGGQGGTAEIVERARRKGRPVLWLPTLDTIVPQVLLEGRRIAVDPLDAFVREVGALLARSPPRPA